MTPKYKCTLINLSVMAMTMVAWMGLYALLIG